MIEIKDKKDCCGCSACVSKCPAKCIELKEDEEGFLYPEVNKVLCMDCSLCEKVCPTISGEFENDRRPLASYIAYAEDLSVRLESSSGGLFSLFAENIIVNGGIVFGAAFDSDWTVRHTAVDLKNELNRLRGSKYMQSRIENTYKEAEKFLKSGRKVLFSGTACQVAGLKTYLGKDYENLYTIDVLCHGVPSQRVWKLYLEEQEKRNDSHVKMVSFRWKNTGWKNYSLKLDFMNETSYSCVYNKDSYMRLFLSDICLRPSCYRCHFKGLCRPSDVTLGDCWGIENHSPEMDDDKGVSVILIHTEKGKTMREAIYDLCRWKSEAVDVILPKTADSRKSVKEPIYRGAFFRTLQLGGGGVFRVLLSMLSSLVIRD